MGTGPIGSVGAGGGGLGFPDMDTSTPTSSGPSCVSGCLCEYSGFTLFINSSAPSPRPIYIVDTKWHIFHMRQVEHAIAQAGFTVILNDNATGNGIIPECGWQRLQTTSALGVGRGSLRINNQTVGLPHPQPGLEDTVNALLVGQYPYVEITLIITLLVGPIIVIILTKITVGLSKKLDSKYFRWRQRKLQKSLQKPPKPRPSRPSTYELKEIKRFNRPSNEKSWILHIPDELQLHILAHMDYESALSLHNTCKYYNELIDDSILKPLQDQYIEAIIAWERHELSTYRWGSNHTPTRQFIALYCSSCKYPRPTSTFALNSHNIDPNSRVCLPCKYTAGEYPEGFVTTTANNALFSYDQPGKQFSFCSICKGHTNLEFQKYLESYTCQNCVNVITSVVKMLLCLMPFSFVFAITAWAVASSGAYTYKVSWVLSRANFFVTGNAPSHLWAWEMITALFWSTILHIFYLICSAPTWARTKQSFIYHNTVFAGLLALGWIGVAIGMIYEQHVIRPQEFLVYDRHSIAVIPLCIIEG